MNKKRALIIVNWLIVGFITLLSITFITLCIIIKVRENSSVEKVDEVEVEKPNVIDYFACSDYCPLDDSAYMLKIYDGVTDPDDCNKLKGEYRVIYGWQEVKICVVK